MPDPRPDPALAALVDNVQRRWLALGPNLRGALWMLISGLLFTFMGVLVKFLGQRLDSFQISFFRAAFGFLTVLPFAFAAGLRPLRTKRPWAHILRGLFGMAGMFCGYYSVVHMPLADATALSFTRPLFVIVLAVFFLGETVRIRRWTATIAGFIGVVVMLRPGGEIQPAALVAIFGALAVAGVVIMVKDLTRTEQPIAILFYFGLVSTAVSLPAALIVWQVPSLPEFVLLVLIGALGAAGQGAAVRSYMCGDATLMAPFDYLRLLFSGFLGWLVFAEVPDRWTWIGAAIIVASTLYIGFREAQLSRQKRGG